MQVVAAFVKEPDQTNIIAEDIGTVITRIGQGNLPTAAADRFCHK